MFKRLCAIILVVSVLVTSTIPSAALAQVSSLPAPGSMLNKTPDFSPLLMQGVRVHPDNALMFDFIMDSGDSGLATDSAAFRQEAGKLVNYFLASLTIKEEDLWVNLSPFEHNRILSPDLEKTELGRDMLAQDYILKQLSASLIYPEKALGETFWNRVYARAREEFGTTNIPVDTFHKIWIKADKARVIEHDGAAYVAGAHLKVMLEQDYLAISRTPSEGEGSDIARDILREVIVPEIENEVNRGTHFAPLRQMFHSMILATWYKLALKDALLNRIYSDRGKTGGVLAADPAETEKIYERYIEAYKKGVFNYIKEIPGTNEEPSLPRKYFSGGVDGNLAQTLERVDAAAAPTELTASGNDRRTAVTVQLQTVAPSTENALPQQETQRINDFLAGHPGTSTDASMLSDLNELINIIRNLPESMLKNRFEELSMLTSKKQLLILRDLFKKIRGLDETGVENLISRINAQGLRQSEMNDLVENLQQTIWARKTTSGVAVSTDLYISFLKKRIALSLSFIVLGFISGSFAALDMTDNGVEWTSLLAIFASYTFFMLARHLDGYVNAIKEQPAKRLLTQSDFINLAEQFLVLYQNNEAIPADDEERARTALEYEVFFWLQHEKYIATEELPAVVRAVSQQMSLTKLKGLGNYWNISVNHPDNPQTSNTDQSQAAKGGIDLNGKTMSLDISRTAANAAIRPDPSATDGLGDSVFSGLQGIIIRIVPVESPAVFLGV